MLKNRHKTRLCCHKQDMHEIEICVQCVVKCIPFLHIKKMMTLHTNDAGLQHFYSKLGDVQPTTWQAVFQILLNSFNTYYLL